jgi:hypothetical protein
MTGRWFERPEAERFPRATRRRPWSRASDRLLLWAMILALSAAAAWVVRVGSGSDSVVSGIIWIAPCAWGAVTVGAELRRRRGREQP